MKKHHPVENFWDLTPIDSVLRSRQFIVAHPNLVNSPVTFWAVFRGGADIAIEASPFLRQITADNAVYYTWDAFERLMSPYFTKENLQLLYTEIQRYNQCTY